MAAEQQLKFIIDAVDRTKGVFKDVESGIGGVQNKLKDMQPTFKKMAMFGTAAFGAIAAGVVIATKEAGIAEGAWNKFNTVFGEGAGEMSEWVSELRKNMPTATHEIVKMAAGLQDLLIPMGFTREEGMKLTKQSLELANQIAAFNDVDPTEVLEAMRSGFVGATEPLRRFGIDARITALESIAQKEGLIGLEETFNDLDPAIRMNIQSQALMIQMTNQSADAISGFGVNQDSYLRRSQEMAARTLEMKATIGEAFLPLLDEIQKKILPVIQSMVDWVKENPELTKTIVLVAGAIAGLVAVIGLLGLALPAIIVGFGFLLSPIGLVIAAVLALVAAGVWLMFNWDKVKEYFILTWEGIKIIFWENIAEIKKSMSKWLADLKEGMIIVWTSIKEFFQGLWDDIVGIFTSAYDKIMGIVDKVKGAVGSVKEKISGMVSGIGERIGGALGFQFGTPYVPRTGRYLLHKGEAVVPAGVGIGGGITVNITGGYFLSETVAEEIGSMIIEKLKRRTKL